MWETGEVSSTSETDEEGSSEQSEAPGSRALRETWAATERAKARRRGQLARVCPWLLPLLSHLSRTALTLCWSQS